MSENCGNQECLGGYIYADPVEELKKRGLNPEDYPEARFMKPCPECATRKFSRTVGVRVMSWENWIDRAELSNSVSEFRFWFPAGLNWACLLHGRPNEESRSTGKTHLLSAAGIAYLRAGRSVRYWNAGDISVRRYESVGEAITEFNGLALFDDLGNESNNLDTRDAVDRILDARFRNRRPSIVASSLSLETIEKRYPRFGTRMKTATAIPWSATSFSPDEREGEATP